ncbi:MAG: hypothetical protein M9916_10060 [Crocinitomicaceae bacterium]|nr:hypothetical protein [Crocinitomicaceae bacterium]
MNKFLDTLPKNADYLDNVLFDRSDQGYFVSLLVSNSANIKLLVIHNGIFYNVYMNDNTYKMNNYHKKLKPLLEQKSIIQLTDNQWLEVLNYLIDTTEQFSQKQFNDSLLYYFSNGITNKPIPRMTLLILADKIFQKEQFFIYQDDYSGFYRLDSFVSKGRENKKL